MSSYVSVEVPVKAWDGPPTFPRREVDSGPRSCFPRGTVVKNLPANAGDTRDAGLIPGLGRFPGAGNGNPLQHSCLEDPTDRGAWQAAVHGVAKSWTWLSTHTQLHLFIYCLWLFSCYSKVKMSEQKPYNPQVILTI